MKNKPVKNPILSKLLLCVCSCFLSITAIADTQTSALMVAEQFSDALGSGDESVVLDLLADDVLIYESGGVEASRDEYAGHHLPADMKFLAGMEKTLLSQKVFEQGDLAIITSRSTLKGSYRDKPIDSKSTETLVLKRSENGWKIVHIHWSSR